MKSIQGMGMMHLGIYVFGKYKCILNIDTVDQNAMRQMMRKYVGYKEIVESCIVFTQIHRKHLKHRYTVKHLISIY